MDIPSEEPPKPIDGDVAQEKEARKASRKSKDDKGSRKKDEKTLEQVLKTLNSITSPAEKFDALCKKYTEVVDDNKRQQLAVKVAEKKMVGLQREKDQLQGEQTKAVLSRNRLELLCRELQRQNKVMKEESLARIREEEERRKEVSAKFHATLAEITALMQQNTESNSKLRDENLEMQSQFKGVCEQYSLREQQVEKISQQMKLEGQLADAKLAKAKLELQAQKELLERDKAELMAEVALCQRKCLDHEKTEEALRAQINVYFEKYDEFQNVLTKSNQVYTGFKTEMEKMSKKITRLEKETSTWKQKWESTHKALLALAAEKQAKDAEVALQARQLSQLQKLCRTIQGERTALLQQLSSAGITPKLKAESESARKAVAAMENLLEYAGTGDVAGSAAAVVGDLIQKSDQVDSGTPDQTDVEVPEPAPVVSEAQKPAQKDKEAQKTVPKGTQKPVKNATEVPKAVSAAKPSQSDTSSQNSSSQTDERKGTPQTISGAASSPRTDGKDKIPSGDAESKSPAQPVEKKELPDPAQDAVGPVSLPASPRPSVPPSELVVSASDEEKVPAPTAAIQGCSSPSTDSASGSNNDGSPKETEKSSTTENTDLKDTTPSTKSTVDVSATSLSPRLDVPLVADEKKTVTSPEEENKAVTSVEEAKQVVTSPEESQNMKLDEGKKDAVAPPNEIKKEETSTEGNKVVSSEEDQKSVTTPVEGKKDEVHKGNKSVASSDEGSNGVPSDKDQKSVAPLDEGKKEITSSAVAPSDEVKKNGEGGIVASSEVNEKSVSTPEEAKKEVSSSNEVKKGGTSSNTPQKKTGGKGGSPSAPTPTSVDQKKSKEGRRRKK